MTDVAAPPVPSPSQAPPRHEFGARTVEPGLRLPKDVDMRIGRARPAHLKAGNPRLGTC